jgi:uncharacterized lipoprotein YajG
MTNLLAALTILAAAFTLSGCADLDEVMGRTTAGTPVSEPAQNSVHCDLIFPPAPPSRT